jgi:hypothetical protein
MYRLHHQGDKNALSGMLRRVTLLRIRLLVTADVLPGSPILATLTMEVNLSSEISVLTGASGCTIPEDGILQSGYCFEGKHKLQIVGGGGKKIYIQ